jgi:hypothetical protein
MSHCALLLLQAESTQPCAWHVTSGSGQPVIAAIIKRAQGHERQNMRSMKRPGNFHCVFKNESVCTHDYSLAKSLVDSLIALEHCAQGAVWRGSVTLRCRNLAPVTAYRHNMPNLLHHTLAATFLQAGLAAGAIAWPTACCDIKIQATNFKATPTRPV